MSEEKEVSEEIDKQGNQDASSGDEPESQKPEEPKEAQEISGDDTSDSSIEETNEITEEVIVDKKEEAIETSNDDILESSDEKETKEIAEEVEIDTKEEVEEVSSHNVLETSTKETKDTSEEVEVDKNAKTEVNQDNEHDHHDEEHIDYHGYSKEDLVTAIEAVAKNSSIKQADKALHDMKPVFDTILDKERKEALERFTNTGGDKEDFAFKFSDLDNRFDACYKLLRDRRNQYYKDSEKQRQENLERKDDILEQLRKMLDDEETNASIDQLKQIQQEWRNIGQVPNAYVRTMWANYHALIDRFYDSRSIYFELKELDRRKNLELKTELCAKAEALVLEEDLRVATSSLNELHEEYKHLGPVPKVEQEALWQRFKAASDKVYERRKVFVDELKKDLNTNLEAKLMIVEEIKAFAAFDSDRINDWNTKTKELLSIQKKWEAIRGIPKERAKEVNKQFWGAFKGFFHNKNLFFKKLEEERDRNLQKKEELVGRAVELQSSTDFESTANEYKKLQAAWKEIGPVPQKVREEIYARFKAACDHFFNERRTNSKAAESEYVENFKKKKEIVAKINGLKESKSTEIEEIEKLIIEWNEIGFVPKNDIRKSKNSFHKAVEDYLASADGISEAARGKLNLTVQFGSLKGKPNSNQKLNGKESAIRKQISNLENDISLWNNNLAFFANSKNADKLKEEFNEKIVSAQEKLELLKGQLKIIRTL